jgi:thiol-disulfide isomerase/thioredoxin
MKKIILLVLVVVFSSFTFLGKDEVVFTAKIENRNSDSLVIRGGNNFSKTISLNKKGEFKSTFKIEEGFYQMFDGKEYAQLYLKNGFELVLTMDAAEFDESIVFKGKGAKENNFLVKSAVDSQSYDYDTLLASDEEVFEKLMAERKKNVINAIDNANLDAVFVSKYKEDFENGMKGLTEYYKKGLEVRKMNGAKAPGFDYENYKGGKTSLESLKGKYVYIDVWATWCGPCRAEIPHLKKVEEAYHDKNIEFVSISIDRAKDHDKWKKFVADKELGGIQLFADNDWNSQFVKDFQINGIPRFILVGPNGEIVNADAPRPSSPSLIELFDNILK